MLVSDRTWLQFVETEKYHLLLVPAVINLRTLKFKIIVFSRLLAETWWNKISIFGVLLFVVVVVVVSYLHL